MRPDDMILVSVDDHIAEPPTMFDAHVPASYKEKAPRVVEERDGRVQQWMYGDRRGRNLGLNAVAGKAPEMFNVDATRYDEMRPGCYDVHERVRDMSAGGQLAGMNFPNWTGFAGQVLNEGPDPDVNEVMIRAYNDWHVDEWCGAYPNRFIPVGIVPYFDVERAAAEVRRLASKGCHAVTFPENPTPHGHPSLHSGHWDPFFAACDETGTVICMHIGSSGRSAGTTVDAPASVPLTISGSNAAFTLGDLLWGTWWSRFPNLRIALSEGDVGWIPHFIQRADHVFKRHGAWTQDQPGGTGMLPSEVFKERVYCCFIEDRVGVQLLEHLNADHVCWESDYPHSDSPWPNAPEALEHVFAGIDDEAVDKVTHLNAMRAFQFDPFSTRPRERCTVAALRAEAADVDTVTRLGRPADDGDRATWNVMIESALTAQKR